MTEQLPANASMRDIFDFCTRKGIPSVAQGMIELPPPVGLRKLASELTLRDDVHTYRNRFGTEEYLDGLVNLCKSHYGFHEAFTKDNILATHGVTGACVTVLSYLKTLGKNRVGLISPFYTYHVRELEQVFGEEPNVTYIKLKKNPDDSIKTASKHFYLDVEELENTYLKKGLDILMLCNPGNPTTHVYQKKEIDALVHLCGKYDCNLLLDECYCDMVWDGKIYSPVSLSGDQVQDDVIPKHVFIARGFSKNIGCQSWRVGYLIAHKSLIPKLMQIGDPVYICVPFSQMAVGSFLKDDLQDFVKHQDQTQQLMRDNWKVLSRAFKNALGWEPIEPEGSMYGLFLHKQDSDLGAVQSALELGVGVCHMSMFVEHTPENTGMVRIHCGITHEKALQIKDILEKSK
ncbi:aspartate aminotransferase [Acrasis kona]|uniref:Aspartate aminotransferase n=1 Tax=Acrasis kona TaxID=1008807 RepID=A0AAW2YJK6_9EUKA